MITYDDIKDSLPESGDVCVVVLSGGLDSSILLTTLNYHNRITSNVPVIALSFDYNQKQKIELQKARSVCKQFNIPHQILDLSILGEIAAPMSANITGSDIETPTIKEVLGDPQPKTYVPFRNMILNSLSFSFAESVDAKYICTGLQATDAYGYWDTTPDFVQAMNDVASLNRTHKIKMIAPFNGLSKADEITINESFPEEYKLDYARTMTCYNPKGDIACGTCPSCAERIKAFMINNMIDPIQYAIDIPWKNS